MGWAVAAKLKKFSAGVPEDASSLGWGAARTDFSITSGIIEDTLPQEQHTQPLISYNDILAVIDAVEDDDLDGRCSSEQIEKVGYLLSVLARNGTIPEDFLGCVELEQDI